MPGQQSLAPQGTGRCYVVGSTVSRVPSPLCLNRLLSLPSLARGCVGGIGFVGMSIRSMYQATMIGRRAPDKRYAAYGSVQAIFNHCLC